MTKIGYGAHLELYCLTFMFEGRDVRLKVRSPPAQTYENEPEEWKEVPKVIGSLSFGCHWQQGNKKRLYLNSVRLRDHQN